MPETRGERAIFVVGLVVIALLVAIVAWEQVSPDPRGQPSVVTGRKSAAPAPSATTTTSASFPSSSTGLTNPAPPTQTTTSRAHAPAARSAGTQLQLTARSDTWVSVRQTSKTGPVLFEGTLTGGETRTFAADTFSVRFGAAANVTASLNGRPLRLPGGTYSVQIGHTGLGSRSA